MAEINDFLRKILSENYDKRNPLKAFNSFSYAGSLYFVNPGDVILYQMDPPDYFYLLLSGKALVMNRTLSGDSCVVDIVSATDILGLLEVLNDHPGYAADVVAETKCCIFRIPASYFTKLLEQDGTLCFQALRILGKVAATDMRFAETKALFSSWDVLGFHLYLLSFQSRPHKCTGTRAQLADTLHINLRTLYRYIDQMKNKGYLTLEHGKIVITEDNYAKLNSRYENILLK